MRFHSVLGVVAAIAATTSALAVPESHVLHESRESAPRKWIKRDAVESSRTLPMRIGLKQSNLEVVRGPASAVSWEEDADECTGP